MCIVTDMGQFYKFKGNVFIKSQIEDTDKSYGPGKTFLMK